MVRDPEMYERHKAAMAIAEMTDQDYNTVYKRLLEESQARAAAYGPETHALASEWGPQEYRDVKFPDTTTGARVIDHDGNYYKVLGSQSGDPIDEVYRLKNYKTGEETYKNVDSFRTAGIKKLGRTARLMRKALPYLATLPGSVAMDMLLEPSVADAGDLQSREARLYELANRARFDYNNPNYLQSYRELTPEDIYQNALARNGYLED